MENKNRLALLYQRVGWAFKVLAIWGLDTLRSAVGA